MIYFLIPISIVICYFFMKKRENKRIEEMVLMIENFNNGEYYTPMKQDNFSILEDSIYKLFLKNVEERENIKRLSKSQVENFENIAHQIKTPITSMLIELEFIKKDGVNVSSISDGLKRLNSLSDILLKLSSLDANLTEMKKEKLNIAEIFQYAFDILDLSDDSMKIIESYNCKSFTGDFYWISEAVINILKNASEKSSEIIISSSENPIYVEICIEDDGGGIDNTEFKKIFRRFYKSPDSNGFGIGLNMAKTIVEKNNGTISVKNGEKGAIFSMKFYK